MARTIGSALAVTVLIVAGTVGVPTAQAEPVPVRFAEGVSHGFLRLRSPDGTVLADGEMTQRRHGARVTGRMTFHFRDGSLYDETTVFEERGQFRLVSEHVVQHGPAFPESQDMMIDVPSGNVTVHYTDKGEQKTATAHLDLPPDVANGIVQTLLKNVRADAPPKSFAYVAAAPKPTLVKLLVSVAGRDRFVTGGVARMATHYVLKVDIGGIKGVVADLAGKQPPDSHVWVIPGAAPAIAGAAQPFFAYGPVWRIELTAPQFPAPSREGSGPRATR